MNQGTGEPIVLVSVKPPLLLALRRWLLPLQTDFWTRLNPLRRRKRAAVVVKKTLIPSFVLSLLPLRQLQAEVSIGSSNLLITDECGLATRITVQILVKKKLVQQIDFPEDIARNDFLDRIYATMSLNREKDQLGWQTSDGGAVQRLASNEDVDTAFQTIVNMKKSSRRRKPVFMKVLHLVCSRISLSITLIFLY